MAGNSASAVAVAYALVIGLFVIKTLKFDDIPSVLTNSGLTSAVVLLLVGSAMSFKTVVSLSHAPEIMAEWILSLTENPLLLLLLIKLGKLLFLTLKRSKKYL